MSVTIAIMDGLESNGDYLGWSSDLSGYDLHVEISRI